MLQLAISMYKLECLWLQFIYIIHITCYFEQQCSKTVIAVLVESHYLVDMQIIADIHEAVTFCHNQVRKISFEICFSSFWLDNFAEAWKI